MSILENQVAVVTGAGTGIGRAVAETFAREGAAVALLGRREEKLREVAVRLPGNRVLTCACDVSSRDQVDGVFARIRDRLGPVNLLVNNAGINTVVRSLARIDPSDWDLVVAVNLTGAFNCIRAVLPGMQELGGGVIINVSSIAGKRAAKVAGVAYVASKHGMVGLTHSTNLEEGVQWDPLHGDPSRRGGYAHPGHPTGAGSPRAAGADPSLRGRGGLRPAGGRASAASLRSRNRYHTLDSRLCLTTLSASSAV